jgi:nitric oxide reductase NorD protein
VTGRPYRIRKLEEGDELDINAAIRAQIVNIRQGVNNLTPGIMMRSVRKTRDISVLLLAGFFQINERQSSRWNTSTLRLQLAQQVQRPYLRKRFLPVGDPFAIHGFCSDSRHFVEYFRLKGFRSTLR